MGYLCNFSWRTVVCASLLAAVGTAAPITLTLTGTGNGILAGKGFTNAAFTFTVTGDTTTLQVPTCQGCLGDIDTAPGSPTTFSIAGTNGGTGTLMDNQAIWTDRQGTVGIAHFSDGDMIDITSPTLNGFALTSSIGPVTGTIFVGSATFTTSIGALTFISANNVNFTSTVTTTPTPNIEKVFDFATASTRLAPGQPIQLVGTNFGTGATDAPTVKIGNETAFFQTFFNANNVLAIIPFDVPLGATTVTVTSHGVVSNAFPITISQYAPAIMPGISSFYDMSGTPITSTHMAVPNQQIYLVATGLGATNPSVPAGTEVTAKAPTTAAVGVTVASTAVTPDYAGLELNNPSGYYQVVFEVPANTPAGSTPVTVNVGGVTSSSRSLQVGPAVPFITAILNGATFRANGAAPNSFVSIFGVNFGTNNTTTNVYPDTSFEGVSVTANDTPIPLNYVFATVGQINLVLPSNLPTTGSVVVEVKNPAGASQTFQLKMAADDVGVFRIPDPSKPSRNNGAILFANTAWRVMPASLATAVGFPNCDNAVPATNCGQPAKAKDVIVIFLTGLGKATPNGDPNGQPLAPGTLAPVDGSILYETPVKPTVKIGGLPADVSFSGIAPGNAGLYQLNVTVPDGVPTGDDVPIVITTSDGSTDTVTIGSGPASASH